MYNTSRILIPLLIMIACAMLASGCSDTTQREERPEPQADASRASVPPPAQNDSDTSQAVPGDVPAAAEMTSDRRADERMPPTPAGNDRQFLETALASGLSEVSMSRHVEKRSPTADVRALAKRIADDHDALNARLRTVSPDGLDGVEMDASAKAMDTMLRATATPDLDRMYLQHMAEGHVRSLARYEAAATNAADAAVRKLAGDALPKLREHARAVETRLAQGK